MRKFGLIGRSLAHSFSADYFAAKFVREGISDCSYSLWELPDIGALEALLAAEPALRGFNVTIPYKREVMPLLAECSREAADIGAVNCVKRTDGGLVGYNTDIEGIRASFAALFGDDAPQRALVLGTGGAAQAVRYALAEAGIAFSTVSRDAARGDLTYGELTAGVIDAHRLIINATPVGTYPAVDDAPSLPYDRLTPRHFLFDLVYNPARTQFLIRGARRGARTLNGELMLRTQAEASWRIWNA